MALGTMPLPHPSTEERSCLLSMDLVRRRALDRLYQRRDGVQNLIRALEDYQELRKTRMARLVSFRPVSRNL